MLLTTFLSSRNDRGNYTNWPRNHYRSFISGLPASLITIFYCFNWSIIWCINGYLKKNNDILVIYICILFKRLYQFTFFSNVRTVLIWNKMVAFYFRFLLLDQIHTFKRIINISKFIIQNHKAEQSTILVYHRYRVSQLLYQVYIDM